MIRNILFFLTLCAVLFCTGCHKDENNSPTSPPAGVTADTWQEYETYFKSMRTIGTSNYYGIDDPAQADGHYWARANHTDPAAELAQTAFFQGKKIRIWLGYPYKNEIGDGKPAATIMQAEIVLTLSRDWEQYETHFSSMKISGNSYYFRTADPAQVGGYYWLRLYYTDPILSLAQMAFESGKKIRVWVGYPYTNMTGDGNNTATIKQAEVLWTP